MIQEENQSDNYKKHYNYALKLVSELFYEPSFPPKEDEKITFNGFKLKREDVLRVCHEVLNQ